MTPHPSRRGWVTGAAGIAALATVALVAAQAASGWDLSWSGPTGGGGRSTGGNFVLTGSVGQPLAGRSSGGGYVLDAGFLAGESIKFKRFSPLVAKDGVN